MPVQPTFSWEQTNDELFLHVTLRGVKRTAVDVFVADLFVKVNAAPTYLLAVDLLHAVDADGCSHYFDSEDAALLHVKLRKAEPGVVWSELCLDSQSTGKKAILERRAASMKRAEERYNKMLEARGQQQTQEQRRMNAAQWEVEKEQRAVIEQRTRAEKEAAEAELYAWEEKQQQAEHGAPLPPPATAPATRLSPQTPADLLAAAAPIRTTTTPTGGAPADVPVRGVSTVNVSIDFTPRMLSMPARARGDEEHYRQSRYKPVSIEDSPMFWKERADAFYQSTDWRAAANAYSESIKRDGVFLTCVMNRAACWLHLAEWKKAAEDCTLSLTMLANTPASEITQERYRGLMIKLHARRAAAYCWGDDLKKGLADLRLAAAYRDPASDDDILTDIAALETVMASRRATGAEADGSEGTADAEEAAVAARMQDASALYHKNNHDAACAAYREVLTTDPYNMSARSNLAASLLQRGKFTEALAECERIIAFCEEVAEALQQPGALDVNELDSDDEDELPEDARAGERCVSGAAEEGPGEARGPASDDDAARSSRDDMMRKRRGASRKISESSGQVYLLLKAYVRAAAALCGLKELHRAHQYLSLALRITPYDSDLMDDCNRLAEKIRMDLLVSASAGAPAVAAA